MAIQPFFWAGSIRRRLTIVGAAIPYCFLLTCMLAAAAAASKRGEEIPPGFEGIQETIRVPSVELFDVRGRATKLDAFKGKIVVLNFWATWCGPCVAEIPSLQRLASSLPAEKVVVLLLNQDRGGSAIAAPFLAKLGVQSDRALYDSRGALFRELGLRGLPSTLILGKDGTLLARVEGPIEWDRQDVGAYLEALFLN